MRADNEAAVTWVKRWCVCVLDRRDVLDFMRGRSRMIIPPRIPTMSRRSMPDFP